MSSVFTMVTEEDPRHVIGEQRKLAQRRIAALPSDARKRIAHLERMPDAPARKRQTKRESPERLPCMVNSTGPDYERGPAGPAEAEASTLYGVSRSFEHGPVGADEAEASTSSGVSRSFERGPAGPDEASTSSEMSRSFEIRPIELVEIELIDQDANWGDDEKGVSDSVMQDWLTNVRESDDDDDFNIDDDDFNIDDEAIQFTTTTELACERDMTPFQAEVLHEEDNSNDRALRDIVPDDCFTFSWNRDRNTFHGRRETFTGTSGPTFEVTDQTRAIDIFDKMFDYDFIDRLCVETNRYADQKIALLREQKKLADKSRIHHWTPTHRDEMVTFLTIQILQGLYPLPDEQAYFSFNGFGTMPYFAKTMSYNRYILLKKFLHFVDSQSLQDTTRLCKIRPVLDYFNDKFSSLYMPSQEISIDESKWHGRLSFTQKISSKAAQVGVKTYELCETSTGYLWRFFIYTGKEKPTATTADNDRRNDDHTDSQTNDRPDEDDTTPDRLDDNETNVSTADRPTNATALIVHDLIEPLLHRGHTLIMDKFYNSPLLLRCLKKKNTDCYGTLRLNREFVPESVKTLTKIGLRKGEVVATYCSDLMILVWRDDNIVSMISTYHNPQIGTQDKYNIQTYKPNIVLDYKKHMGRVDRKDQFLSAQPLERLRTKVWYKKLFRRLYNVAIFNCFVIFSSFHRNISHRQFRTTLAEELLKRHRQIDLTTEHRRLNIRSRPTGHIKISVVRRNERQSTEDRPIVEQNHFPIRTGSKYTCCWMCPKKTRTIWKCEECDVNLCIDGCFKAYHKP